MRTVALVASFSIALAGCGASTPHAQPHDSSVAGHEALARHDEGSARSHTSAYDPAATRSRDVCHYKRHAGETEEPICWTSSSNPTDEHRRDAERHRKAAADHRAAATALGDAEARACQGVAAEDRDLSPFRHREDIVRIESLPATGPGEPAQMSVVFRGRPGMSGRSLQRAVDCHLARNASLGHLVPEMEYCPLVPRGVTARVSAVPEGFAVKLTAAGAAASDELARRTRNLAP